MRWYLGERSFNGRSRIAPALLRLHADIRLGPAEEHRNAVCFRTQESHARQAMDAPHVATARVRWAVSRRSVQLPAYAMYAWPASPMWIWQQRSRASKAGTARPIAA